jgi:hypothetical protein
MRLTGSGTSIALLLALVGGCSRDSSRPLSSSEALAATKSMRATIHPATGFQLGGSACSSLEVCLVAADGTAQSAEGYKRLAGRFGVQLSDPSCDHALASASTGRAIQQCLATGRFRRWFVATTLTVTRDGNGGNQTRMTLAPVREFG